MKLIGTLTALVLYSTAALADPAGSYNVVGKGPDGGAYKGTATVVKTGETYKVTWVIGSQKFLGTAVGNDDFFAVSYKSGNDTGIAVYGKEGTGWMGIWAYAGATAVGAEELTRR